MTRRRRLCHGAVALLAAAWIGALGAAPASASPALLGGGSGFAALEIDQWRADVARAPFNLTINYQAQGSSFGRSQFTQGTFDYGASDIQYMQQELPQLSSGRCSGRPLAHCFVYVPVSAGGLALMYNLHDGTGRQVTDLKLTRLAACKIFTGAITKWNSPEIVKNNPRLAGVANDIRPVVRADGAGESFVFSEFCKAVAPAVWSAFVAQQKGTQNNSNNSLEFQAGEPTSLWPAQDWGANPVAVPFADGTANYVSDPTSGDGSITYVAAGYAKVRDFPTASLQNAAGAFTQPDEENVTVALAYASPLGNGTFKLAFNGPDARAYFPSTYSYILAQTTGYGADKGAVLSRFLCYAVSKGQANAPALRYARLSSELENIAIDAIVRIPGAPSKAGCPVAGAPPPPPPISVVGGGSLGGTTGTTAPGAAAGSTGTTNAKTAAAQKAAVKAKAKAAAIAKAKRQAAKAQAVRTEQVDRALADAAAGYHKPESRISSWWLALGPAPLAFAVVWGWHLAPVWILVGGAMLAWVFSRSRLRRRGVAG
jgi:ABC-type phosphate transport system substrate-binding protein